MEMWRILLILILIVGMSLVLLREESEGLAESEIEQAFMMLMRVKGILVVSQKSSSIRGDRNLLQLPNLPLNLDTISEDLNSKLSVCIFWALLTVREEEMKEILCQGSNMEFLDWDEGRALSFDIPSFLPPC